MTAFDYSSLAASAATLLERFGTPGCRVIRPAGVDVDPDRPWKGDPLPDEVVLASVTLLPYEASRVTLGAPMTGREANSIYLTLRQAGMCLMCAGGELVRVGDFVEAPSPAGGTDRLMVKALGAVNPGGTAIIWQLELET